jgi:hypothetical protein
MSPAVELLEAEVVRLRARENDLLQAISKSIHAERATNAKLATLRANAAAVVALYDSPPDGTLDIEPGIEALRRALRD